jgi:hypothetical protein
MPYLLPSQLLKVLSIGNRTPRNKRAPNGLVTFTIMARHSHSGLDSRNFKTFRVLFEKEPYYIPKMSSKRMDCALLFDVDGTLTPSRLVRRVFKTQEVLILSAAVF